MSEVSCVMCLRDTENHAFAYSHRLRDEEGRAECPKLRKLICLKCFATGDDAHDQFFCPPFVEAREKKVARLGLTKEDLKEEIVETGIERSNQVPIGSIRRIDGKIIDKKNHRY